LRDSVQLRVRRTTVRIAISAVLAFLVLGISQVTVDLGTRAIDRPMWVSMHPTLGTAVLVAMMWFIRPFQRILGATGQKARAVAFGAFGVIGQMSILTGFIWLCIGIATHTFHSVILQVVSTAVFIAIGALFVLPLANLIMIPLSLIVAFPLDWLFPLKAQTKPDQPNFDDRIENGDSVDDPGLDEEFLSFFGEASGQGPDEAVTERDQRTIGGDSSPKGETRQIPKEDEKEGEKSNGDKR